MSMAPQQAAGSIDPAHIRFATDLTGQLNQKRNEDEVRDGKVFIVLAHGQGTDIQCRKYQNITVTLKSPGAFDNPILPIRIGVESNRPSHVEIFRRGTEGKKGGWESLKPCYSLESLASTLADRLR